jgi:hypothetical protein
VLPEQRQVEHDADALLDDQLRDDLAGAGLERHVGALAAEDDDRQPWRLAVGRRADAPLVALRVDEHDLLAGVTSCSTRRRIV